MVTVRVCSKLKTTENRLFLTNKVGKNSRYFVGVFNKTIIPLVLVGYEMIIANSALRASLAIYHLIFNSHSWNNCKLLNVILPNIANVFQVWRTLAGYEESARDLSQSEAEKYLE